MGVAAALGLEAPTRSPARAKAVTLLRAVPRGQPATHTCTDARARPAPFCFAIPVVGPPGTHRCAALRPGFASWPRAQSQRRCGRGRGPRALQRGASAAGRSGRERAGGGGGAEQHALSQAAQVLQDGGELGAAGGGGGGGVTVVVEWGTVPASPLLLQPLLLPWAPHRISGLVSQQRHASSW
jgi:hypothetical protein